MLKKVFCLPIRAYRYFLSPYCGHSCRFVPSCSQYALDAIEKYGVCRGSWKALGRLLRCNPLFPGGIDPA